MNHVALRAWDIDHVLVGPGGVIAVETKWSARGWTLDPPDPGVVRAADQIRANARDLRLWSPLRKPDIETVAPVVFLWGPSQDDLPAPPANQCMLGDVMVVRGVQGARLWRLSIQKETLSAGRSVAEIRDLWDVLEEHVRRRDAHDMANDPPPTTLLRLYWIGVGTLIAAIGAFILGLQTLRLGSWWACSICMVALAILGLGARRIGHLRVPAVGWIAGALAAALLVATVAFLRLIS